MPVTIETPYGPIDISVMPPEMGKDPITELVEAAQALVSGVEPFDHFWLVDHEALERLKAALVPIGTD